MPNIESNINFFFFHRSRFSTDFFRRMKLLHMFGNHDFFYNPEITLFNSHSQQSSRRTTISQCLRILSEHDIGVGKRIAL